MDFIILSPGKQSHNHKSIPKKQKKGISALKKAFPVENSTPRHLLSDGVVFTSLSF
jgi:hypothetical protein